MNTAEAGRRAEGLVAKFLEERGWRILHRNFRSGRSEIDLVAERDEVVAFVEVRARRRADFGHPFETIGRKKQAALRMAAEAWIGEHDRSTYTYRFDAAAVTRSPEGRVAIELVEDAWNA